MNRAEQIAAVLEAVRALADDHIADPKPGDLVGAITIPAAARLRVGELIRVTGPGSWELEEDRPKLADRIEGHQ